MQTNLNLYKITLLEEEIRDDGNDCGGQKNQAEGRVPFFHAIRHVHAEETTDGRRNHQDDGDGGQSFHDDIQVV